MKKYSIIITFSTSLLLNYILAQDLILGNSLSDCIRFERLLDCTDCRDAETYGGVQLPYDDIPLDSVK